MSQNAPLVVRIDETSGTEEALTLDPSRLAPGSPDARPVRAQSVQRSGRAVSYRHLAQQRGAWRVSYTENELCVLTQGRVRLSDDHGHGWTFNIGERSWCRPVFKGCGKPSNRHRSSTRSTSRLPSRNDADVSHAVHRHGADAPRGANDRARRRFTRNSLARICTAPPGGMRVASATIRALARIACCFSATERY